MHAIDEPHKSRPRCINPLDTNTSFPSHVIISAAAFLQLTPKGSYLKPLPDRKSRMNVHMILTTYAA